MNKTIHNSNLKPFIFMILAIGIIVCGVMTVFDKKEEVIISPEPVIQEEVLGNKLEARLKPIDVKPKHKNQITEKQSKELEKNLEKIDKGELKLKGFSGDFEEELLKQLIK